jgi:hypothetical protein
MLEQEHGEGWSVGPIERPLGRGVNFQIEVAYVQSIRNVLVEQGVVLFREVKDSWYEVASNKQEGQREFLVQDPDGYLLRLSQSLGSRAFP